MYPQQTAILLSCIGALILALMLRARETFNRACLRNVNQEEREMLRRACRDTQRLNNELAMALRSMHRTAKPAVEIQGLPVRVASQPKRAPAKKKAPKAR